jgi:hypothetical protein
MWALCFLSLSFAQDTVSAVYNTLTNQAPEKKVNKDKKYK